jgi:cytochrome c oxidase assembly protein subunit 11
MQAPKRMSDRVADPALARRNRRLGLASLGVVAGMVGLSFAAVPLYDLFCRMTGFNGTPMINAAAAPGAGEQVMTIRFNANTQPNLPWRFGPQQASVQLRVGEEGVAFYSARNLAEAPVEGVSTYNVTPEVVGKYFHKVACFCFEAQTLAPGQQVDMPLAFWVDPKIAEDPNTRGIRTITVSYTFFRTLADAERAGALASAGPHVGRRGAVAPTGAAPSATN